MTRRRDDAKVDEAGKGSFPASDPPATSGITGPRIPRNDDAKSAPKDDRRAPAHAERDHAK